MKENQVYSEFHVKSVLKYQQFWIILKYWSISKRCYSHKTDCERVKLTIITKKHEGAVSEMEKLLMHFFSTVLNARCIFGFCVYDMLMGDSQDWWGNSTYINNWFTCVNDYEHVIQSCGVRVKYILAKVRHFGQCQSKYVKSGFKIITFTKPLKSPWGDDSDQSFRLL